MELRQLKHFVAVAEEQHFTRAAARIHVVQSTLSTSISGLERELGAALLTRNNRHVELTAAGRALFPAARKAIAAADNARAAVDAVRGAGSGKLAIGMAKGLGLVDFATVLARYHQRCPEVRVSLRHDVVESLIRATADGDLDLAFVAAPYDARGVTGLPLGSEFLMLATSDHDPLAQQKIVALRDLAEHEFVELGTEFAVRRRIDTVCTELGVQREIGCETDTIDTVLNLVSAGFGIAILPPALIENADRVTGIAIEPAISWEPTLVTSTERLPSPGAVALLDELRVEQLCGSVEPSSDAASDSIAI